MNILLCNYEYPPLGGGGGVVMAALARELARRHTVTVLTSGGFGLPGESLVDGVRILRVPVFFRKQLSVANTPSMLAYLPMGALRAASIRRQAKFDLINTHFALPSGPLGQFLGARFKVPNVLSVHGGDLFDPSKRSSPHRHWWLREAVRQVLLRADSVVGQSRDTLARIRDIYGVARATELIPLGIERPPKVAAGAREQFGLPADAFLIVTVGRLVARKAVVQLVHLLRRCARPNAHLLIIGDGPEAGAIKRSARELGIEAQVHLAGQVSEHCKYEAYAASDVFASTSQHEGFGLVFLEAMAFGLPIVCYDRGGQTDFLRTQETGFVVALNDEAAFADAIAALHDQPELRKRMSYHNGRLVESYFIDKCAQRYEAVFEAAVSNHASGAVRRASA
jgi:glycosyltransferase involved in cell wall biosynthesis